MKVKLLCLALAAGLFGVGASARADSLLEKIAMAVLADKFGIDTSQVTVFQDQTNLSVYELAPLYEGAHYFKRSPSTIWQLRNQGLGWGQIAHRVGMQPGTFNKLRKQGAFDRDRFWATSYHDRFAVPTQRVQVIRKEGGTLEDVLGAIIIGKLTKTDPARVYDQYQTERSWTTITNTRNVRFEDWRRVSTPVRTRYVIVGTPAKSKWKSDNDDDRDRSHSKVKMSHGKGKGDDDKGRGKGKGHEKSKGGKGKGKGG